VVGLFSEPESVGDRLADQFYAYLRAQAEEPV
jgi:hypothetical protein